MIGSIPYHTFPVIHLGPVPIRVFGLSVGLGIVFGIYVFLRFARRRGFDPDALSSLSWLVIALGLVGSRLLFVITHPSDFADRPLSVFAVWQGGLQFSGAFLVAVVAVVWWSRRHPDVPALTLTDGIVLGLVPGLMIGRVGCYAVGEHLGNTTTFPLGVRYLGGATREGPIAVGTVIHNTALYEILLLAPLALLLFAMARWRTAPGAMTATFLLWYGVQRFSTDFLRAYDRTFGGLTGAQYLCIVMMASGAVLWVHLLRGSRAAGAGTPVAARQR
jgi:phosphatidylglycerol:prolipoprotein diacylglycerol transferase